MMTTAAGPTERVEEFILDAFSRGYEPSPSDVAMALCDEDVARGDYEGCSTELDLAAEEYMSAAFTLYEGKESR